MTLNELKEALPRRVSDSLANKLLKTINNGAGSEIDQKLFEETFLDHTHILEGTRYTLDEYLNAVKFVTLSRVMSNSEAWCRVFKEKCREMKEKGIDVHNRASAYNLTKIVMKLTELLIIPPHPYY